MSKHELETTIQLPYEEDVDVCVEFEVHSWGSPGTGPSFHHPGDPPEGLEFDITEITRLDSGDDITKEVLGLPKDILSKIDDAVVERIYELDQDRSGSYDY